MKDTRVAYVLSLGVVKEFRKNGIGKMPQPIHYTPQFPNQTHARSSLEYRFNKETDSEGNKIPGQYRLEVCIGSDWTFIIRQLPIMFKIRSDPKLSNPNPIRVNQIRNACQEADKVTSN